MASAVTTLSDHCDRRLDALAFFEASAAADEPAMRSVANSPADLIAGFVGLLGSALVGWSAALRALDADIKPEALLEQLRNDAVRLRDRRF